MLRQFAGRRKGLYHTLPLDFVFVLRGEKPYHVGFIDRRDGANLRFIRSGIPKDVREQIRVEVAELRSGQGYTTGPMTTAPIRKEKFAALQRGALGAKKTTIILPGDPDE